MGQASGGVAILVKNSIYTTLVNIQSNIKFKAIRVDKHHPVTVCSLYNPPNLNPDPTHIENIINELPKPFIVTEDFNAHNTIWGSTSWFGKKNRRLPTKHVPNEQRKPYTFLRWIRHILKHRFNFL